MNKKSTNGIGINIFSLIKVVAYMVSGYYLVLSLGLGIIAIMAKFGLTGGIVAVVSLIFAFFHFTITNKIA